jgi:hypothetical protein
MQRSPQTKEERLATEAAAWTLTARMKRVQAESRAEEEHDTYPLRPMPRWEDDNKEAPAVSLRRMCGEVDAPTTKPTPTTPEVDSRAVADLPKTRAAADAMVGKAFQAGGFTTNLRWTDARPKIHHPQAWGRILNVNEMDDNQRTMLGRLLEKDITPGAIERVDHKDAKLLCPIFLTIDESGKGRLIHDLRPLNRWMKSTTISYARVKDALDLAMGRRHMVASKLDLRSAFRHIAVERGERNWMCFAVHGMDGKTQVWRWTTLPFGASASPDLFWSALQPALDALRRAGVLHLAYVDDLLVMAENAEELDNAMVKTIETLTRAGWQIAPEKTYPFAHDRIVFLGLRVDFDRSRLAIPTKKLEKLRRRCRAALTKERITLETLQKISGLLSFFMEAVPTVGLFRLALIDATTEAGRLPSRHVWLRGELHAEVDYWATDGADALHHRETWDHDDIESTQHVAGATDSSEDGTGGVGWRSTSVTTPDLREWTTGPPTGHAWRETEHQTILAAALPDGLIGASSTARELAGLVAMLEKMIGRGWLVRRRAKTAAGWRDLEGDAPGQQPGGGIWKDTRREEGARRVEADERQERTRPARRLTKMEWFCDSQAAIGAKRKWRSKSVDISFILRKVMDIAIAYDVEISPHWVSRELGWIPAADFLSRVVGRRLQPEWRTDAADVSAIATAAGVQCPDMLDAWATHTTRVARRYRSRFPEPGSEGPALSTPWTGPVWAFPPHALTRRSLVFWQEECPASNTLILIHRRVDDLSGGASPERVIDLNHSLTGPLLPDDPAGGRAKMTSKHLQASVYRRLPP